MNPHGARKISISGRGSPVGTLVVLLLIIAVTLLTRLPYFETPVIDWDESTFALMGRSILDGQLPYVTYWDFKPPLLFYAFSASIALFGETLFALRFLAVVCVSIAAFFIYLTGRRWGGALDGQQSGQVAGQVAGQIAGQIAGLVSALMFIAASAQWQATMSEHVVAVPLTLMLYLLLRTSHPDRLSWLLIGLSLGAAGFVRSNLIYIAPIVGAYAFLLPTLTGAGWRSGAMALARVVAGTLLIPIAFLLLYALNGELRVLYLALVEAALVYPPAPLDLWSQLERLWSLATRYIAPEELSRWLSALAGALWLLLHRGERHLRARALLLLTLFLSTLYSTLQTPYHGHYILQLELFLCLFAGVIWARLWRSRGLQLSKRSMAVLLLLLGHWSLLEGTQQWLSSVDSHPAPRDPIAQIAEFLNRQEVDGEYIFCTDAHILYFLTSSRVPTPLVHPSNLSRDYFLSLVQGEGYGTREAISEILDHRPRFVVTTHWQAFKDPAMEQLFRDQLHARGYRVVAEFDRYRVLSAAENNER